MSILSIKRGFIMILSLLFYAAPAQSDDPGLINNLRLELKAHYGAIYPHHSYIGYLVDENISGVELMLSTDSYGKTPWDALYRYPRYGLGYHYTSLGNKDVFGHAHTVFMNLEFPLLSSDRKFWLSSQFCFGVALLDRKFDKTANPYNIAISTMINAYASVRLNAGYKINGQNEVFTALMLGHYSNGRMGTTNYGLNVVGMQLGLKTNLLPARYEKQARNDDILTGDHSIDLILNSGWKTDEQLSGEKYLISSLIGEYNYHFSRRLLLGAGIDLFYDGALSPNKEANLGVEASPSDNYQLGFHGSLTARYSRLYFTLNAGRYLYASYTKHSKFYGRIGMRYHPNNRIFFSTSIKAHRAIADFVEWGIGYQFKMKQKPAE